MAGGIELEPDKGVNSKFSFFSRKEDDEMGKKEKRISTMGTHFSRFNTCPRIRIFLANQNVESSLIAEGGRKIRMCNANFYHVSYAG